MSVRIFTAEFMQERRAVVRGFTEKGAALAWAKEKIADDSVACIAMWEMSAPNPKEALAIAAEGKQWYEARACFAVITRNGTRRVKA